MSEIALPIARVPPGLALPGRLLSDERLARLASAGNQRALAVLYERHHQALYRYCRSIVRDHDDAQDALQSTMTHAFVALRARERDLAVRPWLFRIAHNEAVSILRKRRPDDSLLDERLPSDVSVERTVDQRERLQMLVADLKALPERQRAALLMRELSGLSIEDVATAGTVHLLSSSERHKQISPPGQRSTSPASGAVGEGIGVHSGVRTSTPQPPRGRLKVSGAGAAGLPATGGPTLLPLQRTTSGASTPIGTQRAGGGGGRAYGRSGSAGGSSKHPANRRSSSPQSRRGSHGRHSSKQAHPAPPQQAGKGKQGQTPIPAGEHSRHRP
jgi:RNA polymerase sigma factor (sigma-70 family)